jgi:hypothetical protein
VIDQGSIPAHANEVQDCGELHIADVQSVVDMGAVLELLDEFDEANIVVFIYISERSCHALTSSHHDTSRLMATWKVRNPLLLFLVLLGV